MGKIKFSKDISVPRTWTDLKKLINGTEKNLNLQKEEDDKSYYLFCLDGGIAYYCRIFKENQEPAGFTAQQITDNTADRDDFEDNYQSSANREGTISLVHKSTTDNRIRVAVEKSDAEAYDSFSHNYCDKTTWYSQSVRIEDEIAVNSGDNLTYTVEKTHLIDTFHAKITQEDILTDSDGHSYRVSVKVNEVSKDEVDPHTDVGDFNVNYTEGEITFREAQNPAHEVEVTYHYATTSKMVVAPPAGKKLVIETAEVQFTDNIILTDTIVYETVGYVDVFAPHLVDNPYPSGTKIPIKTFKYKGVRDFQSASFKSYPLIPAIGGLNWRGLTHPIIVFNWDYQRGLNLISSYGMEINIYLEHDVPYGGTWSTATLYCTLHEES